MDPAQKVDSLTLALTPWFREEVEKAAAILLREHGTLPSAWYRETPHRIYAVLFGKASKAAGGPTSAEPIDVIIKFNEDRAKKGLKPVLGAMFTQKGILRCVPDA